MLTHLSPDRFTLLEAIEEAPELMDGFGLRRRSSDMPRVGLAVKMYENLSVLDHSATTKGVSARL